MFFAEVNIHVKGKVIHIFAKNHDLFSVIDVLYDKIEQKLKRYREKLTNHRVIPLKETLAAVENELESPEPEEWEASVIESGR
jgi:ribosome-associated translation inhibitor RaiA